MKKFTIFLIALLMITGACQRSQFSTTTRHSRNGRVTYVNHYPAERIRSSNGRIHKSHLQGIEAQNNSSGHDRTSAKNAQATEIPTITPVPISRNEVLIASNSKEPNITGVRQSRIIPEKDHLLSQVNHERSTMVNSNPATINKDTKKFRSPRAAAASTKKIEICGLLGFIFSILGWIPVVGFLFAVTGVILSAVSLHKFNNDPYYKGKGLAIAGLIIGILAFIFNIIFLSVILSNLTMNLNINLGGW
jgi:hypothetical protein